MRHSNPTDGLPVPSPPWCLDWSIAAERVADEPVAVERHADADERAALAAALGVLAVEAAGVVATARPKGAGRILLDGRATATIRQACVVTLEPVTQELDEPFSVAFWPPDQIVPETRPEVEIGEADDPEPLELAGVPLGRIAYETIAAAVDLYPRAEGASLELSIEPESARESPFAILRKLKGTGSADDST
ncbi:MAG: DUF177 domain-containing protein [Hyphomicrobiaceae bacterium]